MGIGNWGNSHHNKLYLHDSLGKLSYSKIKSRLALKEHKQTHKLYLRTNQYPGLICGGRNLNIPHYSWLICQLVAIWLLILFLHQQHSHCLRDWFYSDPVVWAQLATWEQNVSTKALFFQWIAQGHCRGCRSSANAILQWIEHESRRRQSSVGISFIFQSLARLCCCTRYLWKEGHYSSRYTYPRKSHKDMFAVIVSMHWIGFRNRFSSPSTSIYPPDYILLQFVVFVCISSTGELHERVGCLSIGLIL